MPIGKDRRLRRFFQKNRALIVSIIHEDASISEAVKVLEVGV